MRSRGLAPALLLVLLTACAPATGSSQSSQGGVGSSPAAPKRMTAVALSDPPVLVGRLTDHVEPGLDGIENFYNPGLAGTAHSGALVPVIADQVPSVENGQWTVLPDGQ